MESVVIYYDHLEYFTTTKYILWAFGNFLVIWYIFARFGVLYKEKSGNPGPNIFAYKTHFRQQTGRAISEAQS
jgi:hypothetical protein